MAKLDKTKYSKQEATRLMEIRRLEKMSGDKKEEFAKRAKPINFSQQEIVDESRFAHNQNSAFVFEFVVAFWFLCLGLWLKNLKINVEKSY